MFETLTLTETMELDGGLIITGTMVATAIGCLGGGVAVGYAVGTIIEKIW